MKSKKASLKNSTSQEPEIVALDQLGNYASSSILNSSWGDDLKILASELISIFDTKT